MSATTRFSLPLVAGFLFVLAATSATGQSVPFGRVVLLPPLPGGRFVGSGGGAINNRGLAAGLSFTGDDQPEFAQQITAWPNGRPLAPPTPPGTVLSRAEGVDELGRIVGTVEDEAGVVRGARWIGNRFQLLALPPGASVDAMNAVNAQGVVVGRIRPANGPLQGVAWVGSGLQVLPPLPGDDRVFPTGINNLGQAAGTSFNPDRETPVLWIGKRIIPLPLPPGETGAFARDINDAGVVVGFLEEPARAVLWRNRRIEPLALPPGTTSSLALKVNNRGDVLGTVGTDGDGFDVVWIRGRPIPVRDFFPPEFGSPDILSRDINDRRQIVGSIFQDDQQLAFVLTLPAGLD